MIYYAHSDIGKAREKNQDSYYIPSPNDALKLFALADGMGGYKGGEVASSLAILSAKNYLETNFEKIEHTKEEIMKFRDFLNEHGIVATIRRELGSDIEAACGQLRRKNL